MFRNNLLIMKTVNMNSIHELIRKMAAVLIAVDLAQTIAALWNDSKGDMPAFEMALKPFLGKKKILSRTEYTELNKAVTKATKDTYELEPYDPTAVKSYALKPLDKQKNFVMLLRNIRETWEKAGKDGIRFEKMLRPHFDRVKEERIDKKRSDQDLEDLNKAINMATHDAFDLEYDQDLKRYTIKEMSPEPVEK